MNATSALARFNNFEEYFASRAADFCVSKSYNSYFAIELELGYNLKLGYGEESQ